ncbi:hypothetical protein CVH13_01703 [Dehalococcoides mccartyi]|uniref:Uncharacterized protein n=1 Tax=Dehalococcoides mccartyi TaxID=61435 RepID=A0A2J1DRX6_9CHLR|nr:hypothetical protein CVH13_01703 [Dehalococcoides mccartyi]
MTEGKNALELIVIDPEIQRIRDYENKWLVGYEQFLKVDTPNRHCILTEPKILMEAWFEHGVHYTSDSVYSFVAPTPLYDNIPEDLENALEIACGQIRCNILRYKNIPEYHWPEFLLISPAIPAGQFGNQSEIKAGFTDPVNGPSFKLVFETEGKPAKDRAEIILITGIHCVQDNYSGLSANILLRHMKPLVIGRLLKFRLAVNNNWKTLELNFPSDLNIMLRDSVDLSTQKYQKCCKQ